MAVYFFRFCAALFFCGCLVDQHGLPPFAATFSLLCEIWSERGSGVSGRSELIVLSFFCVSSFVLAEMAAVTQRARFARARKRR